MSNELTLYIPDDLQAIIQRVNELNTLVKGKELEAEMEGRKIDYTDFPEYSELHNLHSDMRYKLANCACSALSITL